MLHQRALFGRMEVAEVSVTCRVDGAGRGDGDADSEHNLECSGGLGIWTDLTKCSDWLTSSPRLKPGIPINSGARQSVTRQE